MSDSIDFIRIIVMVLPLIFAVSVHEAAHGWAAFKMGDDTAARAGRITLNPIRHLDPFGSVILPLLLAVSGAPVILGYARPVPVNFARLSDPRRGTIWVSLAGVLANFACLAASGLIFRLLFLLGQTHVAADSPVAPILTNLLLFFGFSVLINAILAVFNLIPIPPLDGSRLVSVFLPPGIQKRLASFERFGIILLLVLLVVKSEIVFTIILFFIAPLITLALGQDGVAFFMALAGQ
jgi:Zn-dependent protease